jgi:predicted translin family RNA/ssDNA-binding protein
MSTPSPPLSHAPPSVSAFSLDAFGSSVVERETKVQSVYDTTRKLQVALFKTKSALQLNEGNDLSAIDALIKSVVPEQATRTPREANLSYRMEEYVRLKAYSHFLQTAQLLPPSNCPYATDEEYLAGACMGLSQDLARYAMGRATARDVDSVSMARNLCGEIQNQLLQFDFRNGPLRRKFDGTKYALKTLETLLYELSVTGTAEPDAKRLKQDTTGLLPEEELTDLRKRMAHRDEMRETLIKKSRDGQKAAKQSIFALQRGDKDKAKQLIEQCETCIKDELLPIVHEEPPLRGGSFSNVLEEYAEARLFYAWLFGKDGEGEAPVGDLLAPEDFTIELQPDEYLGGLCDLTGEVGRFAVQRGTARDTEGVKLALHSNSCILNAIQTMERTPSGINKKMDQLRRSVEKLERMLYEMSLSEATGRKVQTSAENMETEKSED